MFPSKFELKFGARTISVSVTKDEPFADDSIWGYYNSEKNTIVISAEGNPIEHLIHEAEHVIGDLCSHDTTSKKPHDELDRRANAWATFLVDNKEVLKAILDQL